MNITPLMFIDNVYVQVSDNKLHYIDKDRNILKEFDVDFPIKFCYTNPKYCEGTKIFKHPNMYHPIIVEGRIFVQGLEFIYEIVGEKLIELFEIPDLDLNESYSFHSKVFSFNNTL